MLAISSTICMDAAYSLVESHAPQLLCTIAEMTALFAWSYFSRTRGTSPPAQNRNTHPTPLQSRSIHPTPIGTTLQPPEQLPKRVPVTELTSYQIDNGKSSGTFHLYVRGSGVAGVWEKRNSQKPTYIDLTSSFREKKKLSEVCMFIPDDLGKESLHQLTPLGIWHVEDQVVSLVETSNKLYWDVYSKKEGVHHQREVTEDNTVSFVSMHSRTKKVYVNPKDDPHTLKICHKPVPIGVKERASFARDYLVGGHRDQPQLKSVIQECIQISDVSPTKLSENPFRITVRSTSKKSVFLNDPSFRVSPFSVNFAIIRKGPSTRSTSSEKPSCLETSSGKRHARIVYESLEPSLRDSKGPPTLQRRVRVYHLTQKYGVICSDLEDYSLEYDGISKISHVSLRQAREMKESMDSDVKFCGGATEAEIYKKFPLSISKAFVIFRWFSKSDTCLTWARKKLALAKVHLPSKGWISSGRAFFIDRPSHYVYKKAVPASNEYSQL